MSADEGYITFAGGSAEEAEDFILAVKRRAYSKGKHTDNVWIAHFVSICLERKALRWYESLDQETQNDWNLLKRAILDEYNVPSIPPSIPPSIVPTSASALRSTDQWPIPAAGPRQIRVGRIRVGCGSSELQGYISKSFYLDSWCTVTQSQNMAATFEFDVLARIIKFQGSTDDYLAARPRISDWDTNEASESYGATVRNTSQTLVEKHTLSSDVRADLWSMVDQNKLVARWPLKLGGSLELEPTANRANSKKLLYLVKSYRPFASYHGAEFRPLTLYFELLS